MNQSPTEHLILIPGVGGGEWLWRYQQDHLADIATCHVMILDQQDTRAEMADYVLAHAPGTFSIAGHSLGGWVAQEVAARAPDRVRKLFLCDTWASDNQEAISYIQNFRAQMARDR